MVEAPAPEARLRFQEGGHGHLVFFRLQGAGGVYDDPSRAHHPGRLGQQPPLEFHQARQIGLVLAPFQFGVFADHAGGRAGGVHQHGVQAPVQERQPGSVRHQQRRRGKPQPGEIFPHLPHPLQRMVRARHPTAGPGLGAMGRLGSMGCQGNMACQGNQMGQLSARRGAHVQHPPPQQGRGPGDEQLGGGVLDVAIPLPERPRFQDRPERVGPQGPRQPGMGFHLCAGIPQQSRQFRHGDAAGFHPQGRALVAIVGGADGPGGGGAIPAAPALHHPVRMRGAHGQGRGV